jgi:hypothetical protein
MKTSCSTFESVARRRRAVAAGEGRECPAPLSLREGRRGEGILICLRSTVRTPTPPECCGRERGACMGHAL